jgi:TolB-like protein
VSDIFISYNREDMGVARRFAEALIADGLNVWWDQSLQAGETYDEVTEASLRGAKAVIVLWSPRSVVSRWVRAEATLADRAKTLLPVMIEPCERPIMFELTQTTDLSGWSGDRQHPDWLRLVQDVRAFIERGGGATSVAPLAAPESPAPTKARRGEAPSLAVLPFTNRSGLPDDENFAFGFCEDIIDALSQGVNLRVIASSATARFRTAPVLDLEAMGRQLGVRYVLEGNVRRTGEVLRVTAQLVGTDNGEIVWNQRFERPGAELAALQEELVLEVAAALDTNVFRLEMERALHKPSDLTAWECLARAMAANRLISPENMVLALTEARRAVEIAPDYGLAHSMLALTDGGLFYIAAPDNDADIERVRGHIDRAMALDPSNPAVLANAAAASCYIHLPESGLALAEKAIRARPGYGFAHFAAGLANILLDRNAAAIDQLLIYRKLEPDSHLQFVASAWVGVAHARAGDFDAACAAFHHCLDLVPLYAPATMLLAAVLEEAGRHSEAAPLAAELRRMSTSFSPAQQELQMMRLFTGSPLQERMLAHLRNLNVVPGSV